MRTHVLPLLLAAVAIALPACDNAGSPTASAERAAASPLMIEPIIDDGGGGGGGGTTAPIPPFSPPPPPFASVPNLPAGLGGFSLAPQSCLQIPHVSISFSNDVVRGTTLYFRGVVVPKSVANFAIYNQSGQLVKSHITQGARDNCVIHHEPEAFSTWGFAPGYYYVYASYWSLSWTPPFDNFSGLPFSHHGRFIQALRIR